jgi:hypothetical protein
MNPITLVAFITAVLKHRPLWKARTIEDFFSLTPEQVRERIDNGEFPWAFNISLGKKTDLRVLSWSVMETHLGPFKEIGATKNLALPEVINLILPQRDIRSTELQRRLSCSPEHVYALAPRNFKVTRKPLQAGGPNSYTVFSRASVENFLIRRRVL